MHDPISLDNIKNHTALPYITWGLIQDLKTKEKRDPSYKMLLDRHLRIRNQISKQEGKRRKKKILVRKQSNSSIRDELKFEKVTLDLSHLGWIKEVKLRGIENRYHNKLR